LQLTAEITISRPPETVWTWIREVDRYRDWNPFLCAVEGEPRVGGTLHVTLGASNGYQSRERVTVTELAEAESLRFRSSLLRRGLLDTDFWIRLVPVDGATRVVSRAEITGWLAKYASSRRLTCIARGWVGMNEALKRRVEAL
jgi:uncharacterized protein YndB with AHSA1/START domain